VPVIISFYGTPTDVDSYGGGPPGSPNEDQVVGIPTLDVSFTNTTSGPQGTCVWTFGDGSQTTSCGSVSHSYSTRGTYDVTLTIDGQAYTRPSYVLVSCQVPAFAGVRRYSAQTTWANAGFIASNLTTLAGNGNYKIGYQSLAGGMVNPPGGCGGATIQVGP
jgi:PKD repeat protein